MSLRIYLDGVPIPLDQVSGENGISVTITTEADDGNMIVKSATNELTFYGAAYDTLKAALLDPPDGRLRMVPIEFFDDCTSPMVSVFKGVIRGDTIGWCDGTCAITCHAIEHKPAKNCINSTLIWDNWNGFQQAAHPRMVYCDELRPDWLHQVIMICSIILLGGMDALIPIIAVISVIIDVINAIIDAINVLPGVNISHIDFDGDPSTSFLTEWTNFRDSLINTLIGCGRRHPSPLVRDYILNVCGKCGLTFQSSILNDPASDYYNLVYFNATNRKGASADDNGNTYIDENKPISTLDTFLNSIAPVFNAGFTIVGKKLYFERKDNLPHGAAWINPQTLGNRLVGHVCYKWRSDMPAAFTNIGYSSDALDVTGNEAVAYYQDIIDWNVPFIGLMVDDLQEGVQSGELTQQFQFGMLRNRRDGIAGDILDSFKDLLPELTHRINLYGHVMLLENGMASLPKLLIWDGGDRSFGLVKRGYDPGGDGGTAFGKPPDQLYNFPMMIDTFGVTPHTAYPQDQPNMSLYGRFHAIQDPRVLVDRGMQFTFTVERYTAAELMAVDPMAVVPLPLGNGHITEIVINLSDRTMNITGKI